MDAGAPAAPKVVKAEISDGSPVWQPNNVGASVGDVIEWSVGSGFHGLRITNWAAVKDHVEIETVQGQQSFDAT